VEGGEDFGGLVLWGFGWVFECWTLGVRDPRLSRGVRGIARPKSGTWGTRCFVRGIPRPRGGTWGTRFVVEPGGGVAEEPGDNAEALFGDRRFADFNAGGEGAELRVGGDLFDGEGVAVAVGFAGQVDAGDLEAVEEQAGAFGVDLVAGDAEDDLADGALDGSAVFGQGEVELGLAAAVLGGVVDGTARGVVVVAELLVAEAGAAAAVAVGEDVAALVAFGFLLHGGIPLDTCRSQSIRKKGLDAGLRRRPLWVKCEGPAFGRAFLFSRFNCSGLSGTNMQTLFACFHGVRWPGA
jgi:hypothetical protein